MTQACAVTFEAVSKRLAKRVVLSGFDLTVQQGECVALVGGNGVGKTTSLKILLDFQHADSGAVTVFGIPSVAVRARERIAFLPERFVPPQHLSGQEFLNLMRRLHAGSASTEAQAHHLEALELDGEALNRPVRGYSKGMAQKLGLIACLASGKDFLVLDEPMSGLDPKARILVRRQLAALNQAGHSILFTSHSLSDVEALCQRLAILSDGRVAFQGSPQECRERFATNSLEDAYLACIDAAAH